MRQTTDSLLMIRPTHYRFNEETAINNHFQTNLDLDSAKINQFAQEEFDGFVEQLRKKNIQVVVVSDYKNSDSPDSIFPNNWVTCHEDGRLVTYPMFAKNRRCERRNDIVTLLQKKYHFNQIIEYQNWEDKNIFLEGTGSLILDRTNKYAYCALSPRANKELFLKFCTDFKYQPIPFEAFQTVKGKRKLIYHTNVMMGLGKQFAVICLESIDDENQRKTVISALKNTSKKLIEITEEQVHQFVGNVLQVQNTLKEYFLIMSKTAEKALTMEQRSQIEKYSEIIAVNIPTIEAVGGGSARCMMAEIFWSKNE